MDSFAVDFAESGAGFEADLVVDLGLGWGFEALAKRFFCAFHAFLLTLFVSCKSSRQINDNIQTNKKNKIS